MKQDLTVKGATGYEHANTSVKSYVDEFRKNEVICVSLKKLNSYKTELLKECKDSEILEAQKAVDEAKKRLDKLTTNYVLSDSLYLNLQTECLRSAVSEFSRTHNINNFFTWFDTNDKDKQVEIIDTVQKLGSKVSDLHKSFAKGAKVARKKKESIEDLKAQMLELQKKLAEAQKA